RRGWGSGGAPPPPRHENLKSFRVLVIDCHPLLPTGNAVGSALARLAERLARTGVKVAHASPLLPDLAESARIFMRLWSSFRAAMAPPNVYAEMRSAAAALSPDDASLAAERARGAVMSHRDWFAADVPRPPLPHPCRLLFHASALLPSPRMG